MTAPSLRILIAVIAAVGLLGGVAIVTADAGDDDRTLFDRMHDGIVDHAPGDHHDGDHAAHHAEHHGGDHAEHHAAHHDDERHAEHHADGDHAEHHADGGHCN